ncbi:XkdX family protein [Limosilactobacillus oris]|nr:XkdX family protein [Limosilactobacillus oris]
MVEFVKLMAELNQDIKPYVVIGTITAEQYKQFTGQDYAPAAPAAV